MSQSTFDSLLQKYLTGECTAEEEKAVLAWYETLIKETDLNLSAAEKEKIAARIWEAMGKGAVVPATGRLVTLHWKIARIAAAAACVILLAGAGTWYWGRRNETSPQLTGIVRPRELVRLANETTETSKIVLADSSVVLLQPGASLQYPRQVEGNTNEVYLSGSAFFEVRHDAHRHFIVHADDRLTTEVLGTSFAIIQGKTPDKIEVEVVTGKVCVYQRQEETSADKAEEKIILTPNKKVVFNPLTHSFITGLMDRPQPIRHESLQEGPDGSPHENLFVFEDAPLDTVVKVMSKAYGIGIIVATAPLGRYHFTGDISKYDLNKQLDIICRSTRAVHEVNGTQIILKEK